MNTQTVDLPQDVIANILSYLPPEDLFNATQICKSWNSTLKPDLVWRNVAQSMLNLPEPSQGSWKEQCKTLHRWTTWKPQEFSLSPSTYDSWPILENTAVFEVVQTDSTRPFLYSIRNLRDHEELYQIDLEEHASAAIVCDTTHGGRWTFLDESGSIVQFDLKTGSCINRFNREAIPSPALADLYVNDDEIIISMDNRVEIWDLQQRRLSQTFTIEEGRAIHNICSTPNFVLVLSYMSGSRSIFAINKKDPSIQTQIDVGSGVDVGTFRSSGSYCVLAVQHGRELRVYEDSPDAQFQLVRIHHIRPNISCQTTVEMYRNWVCVNQGEEFYILDVRNGREIVSQKLNWGKAYLQVSSQALLVSQKYHDTFWGDQRKLSLYDFSGRASQAPSDSSWCDIV